MEQYKDSSGRVDVDFFHDIWEESGIKPQALLDQPVLPSELSIIATVRQELSLGDAIPYTEMQAWLVDHPTLDGARFKQLLRTYDAALLSK